VQYDATLPLGPDLPAGLRLLRHQHHPAAVQQPDPPMLEDLGLSALVIGFILTWDNIIEVM
jgi:hypothetical protein